MGGGGCVDLCARRRLRARVQRKRLAPKGCDRRGERLERCAAAAAAERAIEGQVRLSLHVEAGN
eukprot:4150840-Prymnesium_polylepis.1